jgi:hypothetical protein
MGGALLVWWLIAAGICMLVISLAPIGCGVSFHYAQGRAVVRVVVVLAHLIHWRVVLPTRWIRINPGGLSLRVRAGLKPEHGGRYLRETLTLRKLAEELKLGESGLHRILAAFDLLQTLLFGRDPNDNRSRALGSPLLHLLAGSVVAFLRQVCQVEIAWRTRLGTGDALSTALGSGLLWTVKSTFSTLLQQRYRLSQLPQMDVVPEFEAVEFVTDFRCIFHLTLGQIMWRAVCDAAHRWQGKEAGGFGG